MPRIALRGWLLTAVAVSAATIAAVSYWTGALNGLERQTVDARFGIRGTEAPDPGIVIVGLDQKSLAAFNVLPPVPRIYYARLLDRLRAADPRLIALDVQFIGASAHPDQDRAVLAAIARGGPVLLATPDTGRGTSSGLAGARSAPGAIPASAGVDTDPDGVLRRMLYIQVALKTLAVRAAELIEGRGLSPGQFPDNHAWVDFRGPPGTFPVVSMVDVLAGRVPASVFTHKTVLVGVTDPVAKDVFTTAASSNPMSGVEFHANALATILGGFPVNPAGGAIDLIVMLVLVAAPVLLSLRLASLYVMLAAVGALALLLVGAQLAFDGGLIVSLPSPIVGLVLATGGSIAVDGFVERRQRQALQGMLDRYGLLRPATKAFFISYRRDESAWPAHSLHRELAQRFGESSVFMDTHTISPGEEWPQRIQEALLGCSVMLVLIGHFWLEAQAGDGRRRLEDANDWVRLEIEAALRRAELVVVPVLLNGVRPPTAEQLPSSLAPLVERQAVAMTGDELGNEVDQILSSIEQARVRRPVARERPGPAPARRGPAAVLQVLAARRDGTGAPNRIPVDAELIVGRAADADVTIDDDQMSERHARVWPSPDGVSIADLGSASGTWVNGARIESALTLTDKSAIRMGKTTIVVSLTRQ